MEKTNRIYLEYIRHMQGQGILIDRLARGGIQLKSSVCTVNIQTDGDVKVLGRNCTGDMESSLRYLSVMDKTMKKHVEWVRERMCGI